MKKLLLAIAFLDVSSAYRISMIVMQFHVSRIIHQLKVLYSVVVFNLIYVMNNLSAFKYTPKMLLHNKAVFQNVTVNAIWMLWFKYKNIPVCMDGFTANPMCPVFTTHKLESTEIGTEIFVPRNYFRWRFGNRLLAKRAMNRLFNVSKRVVAFVGTELSLIFSHSIRMSQELLPTLSTRCHNLRRSLVYCIIAVSALCFHDTIISQKEAFATQFYFSNSTGGYITTAGSNSNPCTLIAPCADFNGTTLDNVGALSAGDIVYFDQGDTWYLEEVIINSNGTSGNPIVVSCYDGSGECDDDWVVFYGAEVKTGFVQVGSTAIWTLANQSQTHLKVVSQNSVDCPGTVSDHCGLGKWATDVTTLAEGTFLRSGTTLYINPWGTGDPNTLNIRVPVGTHTTGLNDGTRGLVSTSRTSAITYGNHVTFKRIWVHTPNGVGFSSSSTNARFENCRLTASGSDGVLCFVGPNTGTATEFCEDMRWYGTGDPIKDGETASDSIVEWGAMCSSGCGQGITYYGPRGAVYKSVVRNCGMAGIDMLDARPTWQVDEFLIARNLIYDNGRQQVNPSYDANIYIDGGNTGTIIGNQVSGSGAVSGAMNARIGVHVGSEHSLDYGKIAHDVDIVNNFIYKSGWAVTGTDNTGSAANGANSPDIYNVRWINNTIMAYDAGDFEYAVRMPDANTSIADNHVFRNNIFICDNSNPCWSIGSSHSFIDSDYNVFFRRGGSTTLFNINSVAKTLTTWRTDTSEDANSINSDPLLISNNENSPNARLQRTAEGYGSNSPAIDAGMESPWTAMSYLTTYFSDLEDLWTLYGSTRVDNALDDVATNMDIGYHHPTTSETVQGVLTNTNVEPASLVTDSVGNVVFTFTVQQAWPSTGKLVATFPTSLGNGFTFSSGSTTTASCTTNCDGSLAFSAASNVMTLTRSGGSSVAAGTAVTITATNIKVPNTAGTTGVYGLKTTTSADVTIDEQASVTADTISFPPSTEVTITISGVRASNVRFVSS